MVRENPGDYYESKIQLRPYNQNVLDFVRGKINERSNISIVKESKLKTGIDLYLNSNKFALILGKMLKKSFKGDVKISRKLFGRSRSTSKALWRVTVCFRLK